ncbi:MAG: hypothetical protein IJ946_04705 [Clostridia bacterium]|nr:hypothetical protein [Clostridia bacterium]
MKKIPVFRFKKLLSVLLAAVLLFSMVPSFVFNASAATAFLRKESDPATLNDWKAFFGPNATNTTWAGGVWSDKSVFKTAEDYIAATDEVEGNDFKLSIGENNFLVALSAIASSKSIEGYSTLPTDTILVLDLSGSMNVSSGTDPYVTMVNSANSAIERLLNLNANNRVGVVAYSGNTSFGDSSTSTASVILPLGRWEKGIDGNNNRVYLVSSWRQSGSNRYGVKVASGVTGTKAEGVTASFSTNNSKRVEGGTYTQNGIYKAQQMFNEVADITVTDGVQAGTKRTPVMVLMSDGCPTAATTDYSNIGESNSGDGGEDEYGSNGISFLTQLTAAWARDKIEEKYKAEPLVYTLGLNVGSKEPALSLLDPSNNTSTDAYWTTFKALENSATKTMNVNINNNATENKTVTYLAPVNASRGWSEDYVTRYFPANSASDLSDAFEDIVEQIIIQSLYYPTMVESSIGINHDGFLEFDDYIGKNMEVKAVKGIQLGTTLYSGATLAKMIYSGGMGTEANPTEAGDNMVWAVQSRMGITDVTVARKLISDAYQHGQLYYSVDENGQEVYSNYIGWYADKDGKFVGFWDGEDASLSAVPDEFKNTAVFANKSYGFYDAVGEGHRKTDMMYATILVRTTLDGSKTTDASETGDTRVIGKLPASLIPLVEYDIKLNGTDPLDPSSLTIKGATAPSRLLFEVGLSSKIDLLDIENTAPDPLVKDSDGNYVFYTNQWNDISGADYEYSYNENKNTVSYFAPSVENERYYYNVDTPIYTDTNGTLYKGSSAPVYDANNILYHRNLVYRINGSGAVEAIWEYEQISEHVLTHVGDIARREDGSWYVVAGTVHHYFGDYVIPKDSNVTGTIGYSDMPFVHEPEAGKIGQTGYHIDSFLGNNGLLVLNPYEGIKVSKIADATITDREQSYEFTVSADLNASLTLIKEDAQGVRTESTVDFNNTLNVSIKHGEAFYLVGSALIGKDVKVSENTAGKDYKVYSINGDASLEEITLAVAASDIASAEFVNTVPATGDVVISKTVVSDIPSHLNDSFTFKVTFANTSDSEYPVSYSNGMGDTVESNGTVTLKHGESVTIKDLPEDAVVTVEEIGLGGGFTVDGAVKTATVDAGKTAYISFTNTYEAEETDPANLSVSIRKNLTDNTGAAADWNGSFTFRLQQWDGTKYVNLGDPVTISYSKGGENTVAVDLLKNQVYTSVGNYYYRVIEEVDSANVAAGVIYDTVHGRFYVSVADDGNGKLYIESVNSVSEATVSGNTVNVEFNNVYNVTGAAEAVIDINKVVKNIYNQTANILPAGFSFSLFEADDDYNIVNNTPVAASPVTAAAGKARISVVYDELTDVGTHYYVLKENSGTIDNVTYTNKEYCVEITVDDVNGYYSIGVKIMNEDRSVVDTASATASAGNVIAVAEVEGAEFENTFTPESVELAPNLSAVKHLVGRNIVADEFTFALFETESGFVVNENATALLTAKADADGAVTFDKLSYQKEGVYYYVVKEVIPENAVNNKLNGVTYDTKEYHVTVTVTGDSVTGALSATSAIALNGESASAMVFENTYVTEPISAVITGAKHLAGGIRVLQARAFAFELLENGAVIDTVYNNTPYDHYNADFSFNLSYDKVGEHTYTVREKHPAGIDASGKLNGVVYDKNEYTVKVSVTDDGFGKLQASVDYSGQTVQFNNAYSVTPVSAKIVGKKNLFGDSISKYVEDNAFSFALYSANDLNTPLQIVKNNDKGEFEFSLIPQLTFNTVGGYRFVVKELVPAGANPLMVYDKAYFEVEIDVTDNLAGALVYDLRYIRVDDETSNEVNIIFNNTLKVAPISAQITGEKSYNKTLTDGMFSFELYQALPDASGKVNAVGEAVLEVSNAGDAFTFKDEADTGYLTYDKAGDYYYVVKEVVPEGADQNGKYNGVTYDTKEHVVKVTVTESVDTSGRSILTAEVAPENSSGLIIVNSYGVAPVSVTVDGKKNLNGDSISKYTGEKAFEFKLYKEDDLNTVIATAKNNENGEFTFSNVAALTFSAAGDYKFIVKETVPDNADPLMVYDTAYYEVLITVTDDSNGNLTAEQVFTKVTDQKAVKTDIQFNNLYKPAEIKAQISGEKSYNKALNDGMFTFLLYKGEKDASGAVKAVGNALIEVKNVGKSFTFENSEHLTFNQAGEHLFVVKEKLPDGVDANGRLDGITYDKNEYAVTVTVTEGVDTSGRAVLKAEVEAESANGIIVVNNYTTDKTSFTVKGNKELIGRDITDKEFTFLLYDDKGGKIGEATNDINGNFSFAPISIEKAGIYTYTVKEDTSENEEGMTYDQSVYKVELTVTDNGKGELIVSDKYSVENEVKTEIKFVNEYDEPFDSPVTGDTSHVVVWSVIAGVVLLGIIILFVLSRKKCDGEE